MRALALLILAACDPLLDEALAYGRRLQESGVSADMVVQPAMIHDFLRMPGVTAGAIAARQRVADFLASSWMVRRWELGGPGRIRTCDQTVMSGRL
jgi:acetyl esterase